MNRLAGSRLSVMLCIFLSVFSYPHMLYAIHDDLDGIKCLDCHVRIPFDKSRAYLFNAGIAGICSGCHKRPMHSHPVEAVPSIQIPLDMPLDVKGRLTCITCHSFHNGEAVTDGEKTYLLRRQKGKTFCYSCHTKL
jgi:predicted CXXCH cytochrome family protein